MVLSYRVNQTAKVLIESTFHCIDQSRGLQATVEGACKRRAWLRLLGNSELRAHEVHARERPFLCDEPSCIYAATQSGHLTSHTRTHTGERPFPCVL